MKRLGVLFAVGLVLVAPVWAEPPKLLEADWMQRDDLSGVTSTAVSPDGKHVYSAAFKSSTVVAFERGPRGKLKHLQTIENDEGALRSAVALRLSKDGKRAVCASFSAGTVTLFDRDAETGKLKLLSSIGDMGFCIEVALSPDAKNVYVGASGSVKVLSIDDAGAMKEIQDFTMVAKPFHGVRCVKVSADGKNVYAAASHSHEVLSFSRGEDGKIELIGRLGMDVAPSVAGTHYVDESPDGKQVYSVSGRVGGANAVTALTRGKGGNLELLQEFIAGDEGGPERFEGGNEIAVSPDGTLVYAVASISDTLARFSRDPATGKLTFIATLPVGEPSNPGSAGISFSPDGSYCYVADEDASAVWAFRHKAAK